jgi:hypothetical protein
MLTLAAEAAPKHFSRMRVKHLGWLLGLFLVDWCDMTANPSTGYASGQSAGYRITKALALLDSWAGQVRPYRNKSNDKRKKQAAGHGTGRNKCLVDKEKIRGNERCGVKQ